jgi:hypothetical protein
MNLKSNLFLSTGRYYGCLFPILFCGLTAQPLSSQTMDSQTTGPDVFAPGTINALSAALSHDIEDGDAEFGRIHAMQLQAALYARSTKDSGGTSSTADIQAKFSILASVVPSRLIPIDPAATLPLADRVSQLQAAIQASDSSRSNKLLIELIGALGKVVQQQRDAALTSSPDEKFSEYIQASLKLRTLLLSGDVTAAETLAPEVLLETQHYRTAQNRSSLDAENVYDVYDALGRGALQRKDFDAAQKYLILAASTSGNAHLESHGPNLSLARSLLDLGYKETVMAFLTSSKAWWTNPKIDLWIAQIRQGQTPDLSPYSRARF